MNNYAQFPDGSTVEVHQVGPCRVFVAREDGRWHLSIAHPERLPTWDEVKEARYKHLPDKMMVAMFFPPKEDYVNYHPFCFHLWEVQGSEVESHAPSLRGRGRIIVP